MPLKKNDSILSSMNSFIGAVNNMDQTVMVPSLLRDIALDEHTEMNPDVDEGDMCAYYHLLKSLRVHIEWGVRATESTRLTRQNSRSPYMASSSEEEEDENDDSLQNQFQYHLSGLQEVLSKLTVQANALTRFYKQRVGI
ncbi:mid1-interacting protein 1A-like [Corythoichthys intestinalis]|uniref:mid1-interacting protein 1A-like n=1 Tax=Corythoichthys intestinalis TaxID=161448 RepID=UPI0025A56F35|nr:mid1-interacting protein 1A-like [Corythoichthys intestinalis]XP_057708046.1 mid1-interacting protein 1A-like [Corythoichthys intestinalis]